MLMIQAVLSCYVRDPDGFDEDLRSVGADMVLLSHCEFFEEGEKRKKTFEDLSFALKRLRSQGYKVAVWTNSLGWGDPRSREFYERFASACRLTDVEGRTGTAVCTLDEDFRAYMERNLRDIINAGADTVLWDDDLVQSVRPGFLCTCEKHLARFAEKTGRFRTREEIRGLFTGAPTPERAAYVDLMGETMTEFCEALRHCADEIDPTVRMGLCLSFTHYDIEGVEIDKLLELLAGKGNRPFVRLSGAAYWPVLSKKFRSYSLGDVMDFLRMQIGWFRDKDWLICDENDPYPRDRSVVPASFVELYDKVMIANGGTNRNKYIARFSPDGDRTYMEAHIRNMERDERLGELFAGLSPVGFYVHTRMRSLRETTLPDEFPGGGEIMSLFSMPLGAMFLSRFSLPVQFETKGPGVLVGSLAETVPKEDLRSGVLLDSDAAKLLLARGIDPCAELTADGGIAPGPGAEILCGEGGEPLLWTGYGADGSRFAVFGRSVSEIKTRDLPWPDHRKLQNGLAYAFEFLSGRPLPALLKNCPGAYALASSDETGSRLSVLVCNIWPDPIEDPVIELGRRMIPVGSIGTEAIPERDAVRLSRIESFGYAAVSLESVDTDN